MNSSPSQRTVGSGQLLGLITDGAVVSFGVFTVAAHAVVIAGGTISALAWSACAAFAALLALTLYGRRRALGQAYLADLNQDPEPAPRAFDLRGSGVPLLFAAAGLLAWAVTQSPWPAFVGVALSSAAALLAARGAPFAATSPDPTAAAGGEARLAQVVLHVSALACALFTLLSHRPRSDDTLYLHLAVSAADYPMNALLSVQTLHGPPTDTLGPQPFFPPYRVHSFELLGGLVSYLIGVDAPRVVHIGLATLLAWLTPFAVARLLRLLVPRYWLPALLVVLSYYFIEGSASRGYANHALVRMFNGKSALLTLAAPLIMAYGLRLAARPTGFRLLLFALAQVCAVGLSSTGLWLAPTLGMLAVAAGSRGVLELGKRALLALLGSAYVLGVALWVMSQMAGALEPAEFDAATDASEAPLAGAGASPEFAQLTEAVSIALGPERTAVALLAIAVLSLAFAPNALSLRLFAALAFVASLGFANPLLAPLIARRVTGILTYYRFFWLVPVPIMLGTSFTTLLAWLRGRYAPRVAAVVSVAALLAFYAIATDRLVISEANQAKLTFPPVLKAWSHARRVAEETCKFAPAGGVVLASKAVLLQLPTIHRCGHPLIADERWLTMPDEDERERAELVRYVGEAGDIPIGRAHWFMDALARRRIAAVVVGKEAQPNARTKSLARLADYQRVATVDWEQIYVRTPAEAVTKLDAAAGATCSALRGRPEAQVLAPFGVSAALRRRGCVRPVADPALLRTAPDAELDNLLRLERFTFIDADLEPGEEAWLRAELARRNFDAVVMTAPALANKRFKAHLRALGFRSVRAAAGHTVLRRPPSG